MFDEAPEYWQKVSKFVGVLQNMENASFLRNIDSEADEGIWRVVGF